MISILDTLQKEILLTSGEEIQKSTREWATSLILSSTGRNARCDIVNGGTDHTANLVVPSHVYQEVLTEVAAYKLRINPLAKRETRFRDKIPGLPSVIQIDTSIQQSLDCLQMMSSEEIWKRAPSTVRPPDPTNNQQSPRAASAASFPRGSSVTSNISDPSAPSPDKFPPLGKSKKVSIHDDLEAIARSDDYTASTQSGMTPPSMVSTHQKYQEFKQLFRHQQEFLQHGLSQSSNRLNDIETQIKQLRRIDDLEEKMSTSMK